MNNELLGFHNSGLPIRAIGPGMIATACIVSCGECRTVIRGNGGPNRDSKCLSCYRAELAHLCGNEMPVSIQCVYTQELEDESIEVCGNDEASMVSVYLRLPIGEVVPVTDHKDQRGMEYALKRAREQAEALAELFAIPVERFGALE